MVTTVGKKVRAAEPPTELQVTVKMPESAYAVLRRVAAVEDRKLRGIVARAVIEYAERHAPEALEGA